MELFNRKQNQKRACKLALFGMFFITIGVFIFVINPLHLIAEDKLSVYPGSFLFGVFQKPPLELLIKVYAFNITNADRFLSGKDKKVKLEEVGPFVYQEILENQNTTFHPNMTLSFTPKRIQKFIREKSIGDPKDITIYAPNIPYMGITTVASKLSIFTALALRALSKTAGSKLILKTTVEDYFWGHDEPLVTMASSVVPGFINFQKFGILDRMFDEGENNIVMNLPGRKEYLEKEEMMKEKERHAEAQSQKADELATSQDEYVNEIYNSFSYMDDDESAQKSAFKPDIRDYSVESFNGGKGMKFWGYSEDHPEKNTECNTLRGAYDATLFPRNISQGEVFRVYRKAFCRTLPIVFSRSGSLNGIDAYYFELAHDAFDNSLNDSRSSCFCPNNVCLKKGLGDMTPCYYNIPIATSFPHFFNADPSLADAIDGLSPSEEKHGSEAVLQPQLGIPMRVHLRVQVNLIMGDVLANSEMKPFQDVALPLLWVEIVVEDLTPGLQILLHLLFNICPYVQTGAIIVLVVAGISLFATSALIFFCVPKATTKEVNPKLHKRYSAMYMFPSIRREISKIENEEFLAFQGA